MTTASDSAEISQHSPDLLDHVRAGGKSLSDMSQNLLKQLAKNSVSRLTQTPEQQSVINMNTDINNEAQALSKNLSNNASQLFRQQLPGLTRQLLGKRFNTVNKLANMVMPTGTFDKASDQILELLADFASTLSSSDSILEEAGVDSLAKLQGDTARSGRLARALGEKNRYIGMAQGAISGATGIVGAASDIPLSMILIFRTVYLTGRSYGFDLDRPQDRNLIFDALSNVDLTLIAEKQAILLGLRSLSTMLGTGNLQGLQSLLGSNNDVEPLIKFLSDEQGQLKWRLSPSIIDKLTPVIGGAVGAIYNARLLKEVSESASQVFEQARQQALGQSTGQAAISTIEAKLANAAPATSKEVKAAQAEAKEAILNNDDIAKVEITTRAKHDANQEDAATQDESIHKKIGALADDVVDNQPEAKSANTDDKKSSSTSKRTAKAPQKELKDTTDAKAAISDNADIEKVEVTTRPAQDAKQEDAATQDEQIHNQLDALANKMIDDQPAAKTATDDSQSSDDKKSTNPAASNINSANTSAKTKAATDDKKADAPKTTGRNSK